MHSFMRYVSHQYGHPQTNIEELNKHSTTVWPHLVNPHQTALPCTSHQHSSRLLLREQAHVHLGYFAVMRIILFSYMQSWNHQMLQKYISLLKSVIIKTWHIRKLQRSYPGLRCSTSKRWQHPNRSWRPISHLQAIVEHNTLLHHIHSNWQHFQSIQFTSSSQARHTTIQILMNIALHRKFQELTW